MPTLCTRNPNIVNVLTPKSLESAAVNSRVELCNGIYDLVGIAEAVARSAAWDAPI